MRPEVSMKAFETNPYEQSGTLVELLADLRRAVYCIAPHGRRLVDLFRLAEPG